MTVYEVKENMQTELQEKYTIRFEQPYTRKKREEDDVSSGILRSVVL
jgi:hypothetical protein